MNERNDIATADDPVQEELSAYLDGELDAEARAEVERRLAADEAYRVRLKRMEDAWSLLDALPRTEADASFTQSTVEMVAVAAKEEVQEVQRTNAQRRWLGWACGVAVVVLAGLIGYRLVDRAVSAENEQLLEDLPVIENMELYRHVDNIDFLRQLEAEGLFTESVENANVDEAESEEAEADDAT